VVTTAARLHRCRVALRTSATLRRVLRVVDEGDEGTGDAELLTIRRSGHGNALVLTVTGELDVATGPRLRAMLADALAEQATERVVVDLTRVTFMGSTGIAVLVDASWEADQRGRTLRVVTGSAPAVVRPLTATGVDSLLATHPDLDSALGSG
jgi:anti-sigma B factor antagonist